MCHDANKNTLYAIIPYNESIHLNDIRTTARHIQNAQQQSTHQREAKDIGWCLARF